jgi:hypothetical protein
MLPMLPFVRTFGRLVLHPARLRLLQHQIFLP